ncbi:hypothetical protein JXA47_03620 [Candidatus Sumerlaeota bacterium]|nr:hypothetical protein [Candidatus Sumerlaeota bacterium]
MMRARWIPAIALMVICLGCRGLLPSRGPITLDTAKIDEAIRAITEEHGDGIEVSVWLGGLDGAPWYALNENEWRPGASAVKAAYLVELFAAHAGSLDEPLAETDQILSDPTHPAIVHFDERAQAEIRREHEGASVRRIGEMMIHGEGVSNTVYNAAANVTTAALGGAEGITERIHARSPDFGGIAIRRYMLADRNVTGDNEATAASLAAVLRRIAGADLPGVDEETVEAIREVLRGDRAWWLGLHFFKTGALNTNPLTRIESGYHTKRGRVIVYVVMTEQPNPGELTAEAAGERLQATTDRIRDLLLRAARREVHGALSLSPW